MRFVYAKRAERNTKWNLLLPNDGIPLLLGSPLLFYERMNDTSTPSAQECKRFNNPAPVDATDKLAFDPACAPFLLRFDGTTFSISNGTTKRNKWRCNGRQKTVTDVWNIIRNRVKYCKKDGKFWQIIHQLHKVNFITSFFNLNRFHISMIYLSIFFF